jgi:putative membrane protein
MLHIVVEWLVSALALWIVAQIIPGIEVSGFGAAMIATVVIAIVSAIVGPILGFLAFPITVVTMGLFSAVLGSLVLTILSSVLRLLVP